MHSLHKAVPRNRKKLQSIQSVPGIHNDFDGKFLVVEVQVFQLPPEKTLHTDTTHVTECCKKQYRPKSGDWLFRFNHRPDSRPAST